MSGDVSNNLISTPKGPVESPSKTVNIHGTIKKGNDFEWNMSRLYSRREGSSKLKSWSIAILSTALVAPVLLTLIFDIGRRAAFAIGLNSGKSWSLIDETNNLVCKGVHSIREFFFPKDTLEKQNARAEMAMKRSVSTIVDAYRSQNKNNVFKGPLFDQIKKGQKELEKLVNEYIDRNAEKSQDFPRIKFELLSKIQEFFNKEGGNETYVVNKTQHELDPFPIASLAFGEFAQSLNSFSLAKKATDLAKVEYADAVNEEIAQQEIVTVDSSEDKAVTFAAKIVPAEESFVQTLKQNLKAGIVHKEQAIQVLQEMIPQATIATLTNIGLAKSSEVETRFIDEAVKEELITQEQAQEISQQIAPVVDQIAEGAARDIVATNIEGTPAKDDQAVIKVIEQLTEQKKLTEMTQAPFKAQVEKRIPEIRTDRAKLSAAAAEKQSKIEALARKAKQEAEASAAEKKAIAEAKAQDLNDRFAFFYDFLGLIKEKQGKLTQFFTNHSDLEKARRELTSRLGTLQNEKIKWKEGHKEKEVNVLDAAKMYISKMNEIQQLKNISAQERADKIESLQVNFGINKATVDKILQLTNVISSLMDVTQEESKVSQDIQSLYGHLQQFIFDYSNKACMDARAELNEDQKKTLNQLEFEVGNKQRTLKTLFKELKLILPGPDSKISSEKLFQLMNKAVNSFRTRKAASDGDKQTEEMTDKPTVGPILQSEKGATLDSKTLEETEGPTPDANDLSGKVISSKVEDFPKPGRLQNLVWSYAPSRLYNYLYGNQPQAKVS